MFGKAIKASGVLFSPEVTFIENLHQTKQNKETKLVTLRNRRAIMRLHFPTLSVHIYTFFAQEFFTFLYVYFSYVM